MESVQTPRAEPTPIGGPTGRFRLGARRLGARPVGTRRLSRRGLVRALGVLWLLDAALQAQPALFTAAAWRDSVAQQAMAQPALLARLVLLVTSTVAHSPVLVNALIVGGEATMGLLLVVGGRWERRALAASLAWSVVVWTVGQGLGGLATGFALVAAGAPGSAAVYALLAGALWPAGASRWPWRVALGGWVAIWAGGALLPLTWRLPARQVLAANLEESAVGSAHWVVQLEESASRLVAGHPAVSVGSLTVLGLVVGIGSLIGRTRRPALWLGAGSAAVFWVVGQALGGVSAAGVSDIGTAPALVLLAVVIAADPRGRGSAQPQRRRVDRRGRGPAQHAGRDEAREHVALSLTRQRQM